MEYTFSQNLGLCAVGKSVWLLFNYVSLMSLCSHWAGSAGLGKGTFFGQGSDLNKPEMGCALPKVKASGYKLTK